MTLRCKRSQSAKGPLPRLMVHFLTLMSQTFILNRDKVPDIQFVDLDIAVRVSEGNGTYTINPWGVNKYYGEDSTDQVVWYTSDFGRWIGFPNGTKVVISDGLVTRITQESVSVPEGGYVLFVGNSANNK